MHHRPWGQPTLLAAAFNQRLLGNLALGDVVHGADVAAAWIGAAVWRGGCDLHPIQTFELARRTGDVARIRFRAGDRVSTRSLLRCMRALSGSQIIARFTRMR